MTLHKCRHCKKQFLERRQYSLHLKTHIEEISCDIADPYECAICTKTFSSCKNLTCHTKAANGHDVSLGYKCGLCKRLYRTSQSLAAHVRMHEEKKTFPCATCFRHFTKGSIYVHIRECAAVKMPTKDLPEDQYRSTKKECTKYMYQCYLCKQSFLHRITLQRHTMMHYEGNVCMFECEQCRKYFPSDGCLKTHKYTAHGRGKITKKKKEHPFQCKLCKERFSSSKEIQTHFHVTHKNIFGPFCISSIFASECGHSCST